MPRPSTGAPGSPKRTGPTSSGGSSATGTAAPTRTISLRRARRTTCGCSPRRCASWCRRAAGGEGGSARAPARRRRERLARGPRASRPPHRPARAPVSPAARAPDARARGAALGDDAPEPCQPARRAGAGAAARGARPARRSRRRFRLTFDELARALRKEGFDARGAVARERARLAAWRRVEVPNRFASEEVGSFGRAESTRTPAGALAPLAGRRGEDEAGRRPGGLGHRPGLGAALRSRRGRRRGEQRLVHSATVVREHGLPCVANVEGALERLREGERSASTGRAGRWRC
jgi:hypothetical protein